MKIYMILNTVVTLLFTPRQPTTLQFQQAIEYYSIGNARSFDSYLTKNGKILLIRPKKKQFDEFLVVITKNHSYEFRLKSTPGKRTALYQILDGRGDKFLTLKYNGLKYRILEGLTTLKIIRQRGEYLTINGIKTTKTSIFYPKNAHLTINGREVR